MNNSLSAFQPHPLIPGGHLQTILPAILFPFKKFPEDKIHYVTLEDGDKIVLLENFANPQKTFSRGCVLLVHGLGSSAHESSIVRHTKRLLEQGYNVFRMNHRGVGEGSKLSRNIYHADRAKDIAQAIEYIAAEKRTKSIIPVGYSLSANMVLKLMGKGQLEKWRALDYISQAVCICPAIDMRASSDVVSKSLFGLYNAKFVKNGIKYLQRRNKYYPDTRKIDPSSIKTLYDLDREYICHEAGYSNVDEYYDSASPKKWLHHIRGKTVVLCAGNDPISASSEKLLESYSQIEIHTTYSGGHLGFLTRKKRSLRVYSWLDDFIISSVA